jgi:hypothetical protein
VAHAQEIVDDFEPLVSGRKINSGDVADLGEFRGGVIYSSLLEALVALTGSY